MVLTIVIFFVATALAFAMIARKVWQLRTGKITVGSYEETEWTGITIDIVRIRLTEATTFGIHHFVLFMLKAWIITTSWIKKIDRTIKNKLMHLLHKNAHYPEGGKPSGFLKKIRRHKDEVVMAIQKESSEEEGKK